MYYVVHQPGHLREKQIYHINLLQEWREPEGWATFTEAEAEDLRPQGVTKDEGTARTEDQVQIGEELLAFQRHEMQRLVREFRDMFHEDLVGKPTIL